MFPDHSHAAASRVAGSHTSSCTVDRLM
jgi:hypothetical protein